MLGRVQRGLESLYRVSTELDVDDFVIDAATRGAFPLPRHAREQLLVAHTDDGLELGLFVDHRALANLARNDPAHRLDTGNLGDFLLAVEGVSHFVYLVWRARAALQVSQLELELQAEVDKYVTCLLTADADGTVSERLRRLLFDHVELADELDDTELDRYRAANENARRYSASLERRFVAPRRVPEMLAELRRFYRLPLAGKLEHISQAA